MAFSAKFKVVLVKIAGPDFTRITPMMRPAIGSPTINPRKMARA
jgi:hypothetical protein